MLLPLRLLLMLLFSYESTPTTTITITTHLPRQPSLLDLLENGGDFIILQHKIALMLADSDAVRRGAAWRPSS